MVRVLSFLLAFSFPLLTGGEPPSSPAPPTTPPVEAPKTAEPPPLPTAATIETMMEEAVKNIARRYNLNDAQREETNKLMKREVNRFLKEHESEVWPVIRDLLASQLGAKPPDREEMMRIGKAAKPLAALAKEAIFKANEEWRIYLAPEQKQVHDYDLAEMEKQFKEIDKNFGSWVEGRPTEHGIFPPPEPADRGPRRPKQPPAGLPEPEVETFRLTVFDTFVEEFIKDYRLDQGQIDSARSILSEFKAKANDFKKAKQEELTKIASEQKAAIEAHDREKIAEAETARKKLFEPIYALFGQMEERLQGLLTTTQIELHAAGRRGPALTPVMIPAAENPPSRAESPVPPPEASPPAEPKPAQPDTQEKKDGD